MNNSSIRLTASVSKPRHILSLICLIQRTVRRTKEGVTCVYLPFALRGFVCCIMALPAWGAADSRRDYSGQISLRLFPAEGAAPLVSFLRPFVVAVDDCRWWIQVGPTVDRASGLAAVEFDEASYDGNELIEQQKVFEASMPNDGTLKIPSTATICLGNAPRINSTYLSVIWLALASKCYFGNAQAFQQPVLRFSTGSPELWFHQQNYAAFSWVGMDGNKSLPSEVRYYSTGAMVARGSSSSTEQRKMPAPFDNGFLESKYSVLGLTKVNGHRFPATAVYEAFSPKPGAASTNDTFAVISCQLTITNISIAPTRQEVPRATMTGLTTVRDFRFVQEFQAPIPVEYLAKEKWLGQDHQEVQLAFRRTLQGVQTRGK